MISVERSLPTFVALCIVSLLTGVQYQAGVVLRPFDALIGIGGVILVGRASIRGRIDALQKNPVYVLFAITYGYRCGSAFLLSGMGTAVKETIQVIEFIVLVHLIAAATRREEDRRIFFRALLVGVGVLSVATALWHIENGSFAGYKQLGDPKYAFSLFVLLAIVSYLRNDTTVRRIVLASAGFLAILSGERKGWVALAAAGLMMYYVLQGRSIRRLVSGVLQPRVVLGGGIAFAIILAGALQFEYVTRQFRTMYDLYVIASKVSLEVDPSTFETSGSNIVRLYVLLFTIRTAFAYPLLGVGTGGWHDALAEAAQSRHSNFLIGAHSEYQRMAVENGLTGLGLYITTWFTALRTVVDRFREAIDRHRTSVLAIAGLTVFGAVINLFLGGGALNILFLALPVGLLLGLKNDSEIEGAQVDG